MNGVSETKFAPEYGITLREVTKVIADLAGYSMQANLEGGYPAGYESVVKNIDLTKNVSAEFTDVITKAEIAQVIYNAFDVQLMEFKMQGGSTPSYVYGSETFLTGVMKMNKIRGVVTDNGYACLSGDSYIGKGKIAIDGLALILPDNFTFATSYIGQQVEAYYTNDLENKNHITSIELVDEEVITFDIKDFEGFTGTSISYLKNGHIVTKQVNKNSELILNNKYEKIWDDSVFDAPNGTVTLVSKGGNEFDMILVTSYEFALVSSIDYDERIIYNKLKGTNITDKYELPDDDEKGIFIEDESGKTLKFTEITKGDSLGIVKSDNYMKIIVKKNPSANVTFTAKNEEDGQVIYSVGDGNYALSKFYDELSVKPEVYLSKLYTVYLNNFNEIILIEVANVEIKGQTSGVLTKAFSGDTDEQDNLNFLRVYGEDGKMKKYVVNERININGETKKFRDVATALDNSLGSVILFSIDEEEKVTEIILPGEFSSTKEIGWYQIAECNTYYYGNGKDINNLFFVNTDTLIYTVPDDPAYYGDEDYFTVNSMTFSSGKQYTEKLTAYGRNKDNVYADVLVIEQDTSSGSGAKKNGRISEEHMFLITEVSIALNDDEMPIKVFKGYEFGWRVSNPVYKEYVVNEEAIMIDVGNPGDKIDETKPITEVGPRTYDELTAGDAIYYGKNIKEELTVIRTAFDYDQKKAFLGGRTTTTTYTFTTNTPWYGGVVSLYGDGIKIATSDVKSPESPAKTPDKINYNDFSEVSKYVVSHVLAPTKIVVVEEGKKGKFTARIGSLDDIVTYKESGAYSNVLISTNWQSAVYATVIYK